jgi:hypothetical protein
MITSWQTLTLENYYEILDIKAETISEYNMELIAIMEDLDIYSDDFLNLSLDYFYEKIERYKFIRGEIITRKVENLELENYNLTLIDINKLELGAWIDLDIWTNKYREKSFEYIASILWRQTQTDQWGNITYEPLDYNVDSRKELFYNVPVDVLKFGFDLWINFKTMILDNFKSVFVDPEDLDENFETENLSDNEIEQIKKEIQRDKEDANLGWQYLLLEVSDGDFIKAKELLKEPIIYILNLLVVKRRLEAKIQNYK